MSKRTINGEVYERTLVLDRANADEEARTVPAALSSEVEVERWFGREQLVHDDDAVDMSRTTDGLPMLFNHNSDLPIGVIRDIHLGDDRKLRGVLHFSKNAKASEVWGDVRDGFLKDISIGYRIQKWEEESDSDLVRVTRWMLHEASVVSVPADSTVGINRNMEGQRMSDTPKDKGGDSAHDDDLNVVDFQITRERNLKEGKQAGQKEERKRIADIRRTFGPHLTRGAEYTDLMDTCIEKGVPVARSTDALLELIAGEHEPLSGDFQQDEYNGSLDRQSIDDIGPAARKPATATRGTSVKMGADQQDKYNDIVEKAISVRVYAETDKDIIREVHASEYGSMMVSEMARDYLNRNRIDCRGLKREQLIGTAMSRAIIGHGTSDFANILENVANKSLLLGYEESPETWPMIARSISVPDFKSNSFVGLSEFGSLPEVKENGEYTYGTMSDRKESAQLATFGRLFSISRQALANDDLDSLGNIPRGIGRAASRTIGDKVYAVLTSNPTLNQDSTTLFHANHNNDVAGGSGAAPSVTTLDAARTAMATQKDQASATTSLNIRMARLIVPVALQTTADILMTSERDPAEGATTSFNSPNPFRGTFSVVADARLDDADAAEWFASADPNVTDTIGICFLNGQTQPFLEQQEKLEVDGITFKGRIDCVALALDFRGLYRNDGN